MKFPNVPSELTALVDPRLFGAACTGMSPLFDGPLDGESAAETESRHHRARNVCRTCPVRARCNDALNDLPKGQRAGVWAGHIIRTTNQRKSTAA